MIELRVKFKSGESPMVLDISEVAKQSGVAASALRYYERKGLVRPLESGGARRKYSSAVFHQLALIALGQAAGFSLDEIRVMLTPDGEPNIDRTLLAAKADELERKVVRLRAMIRGLRHAVVCPAPSHAACPSFQRLLEAAAAGTRKATDTADASPRRVRAVTR